MKFNLVAMGIIGLGLIVAGALTKCEAMCGSGATLWALALCVEKNNG